MKQVAMIFPGEVDQDLFKEVANEMYFYNAVLEESTEIARKCESGGIGVIISRGGTANLIKKVVNIPVVNCEVTNSDLLANILNIKKDSPQDTHEVAIICYANMAYNVEQIELISGVRVRQFWYWNDSNELYELLKRIKQMGIKVVLGAGMTYRWAKELGMKGYLVQVGQETLRQALERAREIIEIRKKDLAYAEKIKNILAFQQDAIIFLGENGDIEHVNSKAELLIGEYADSLIGRKITEFFNNIEIRENSRIVDAVIKYKDEYIVYSKTPVVVKEKFAGGVFTFRKATDVEKSETQLRKATNKKGFSAKYQLSDILGKSERICDAVKKANIFAQTDATVLITGETGTGKELFANGIHQASFRKEYPFVAVNCAAIPEALLESELFGYEQGAFTGSSRDGKAGLFELAHKGTIFLDEIGELDIRLQGKILRVLQEKEMLRVGGKKIIPVDIRVIAATNRDLIEAVEKGNFRSDLFYRLNSLKVEVPPLRDRRGDIETLTRHFILQFNYKFKKSIDYLSYKELGVLNEYYWPGNVRELEAFINRYCMLKNHISDRELFAELELSKESTNIYRASDEVVVAIQDIEKMMDDIFQQVYEKNACNKSKTADILGVNRMTVAKRVK